MTRMEEYQRLMEELTMVPAETEETIRRAKTRKRRRTILWQPLGGVAAVFLCFVVLVNLFPTVAYACSKIPILADLVEAVSFSSSLSKAVEHDYVQVVDQTETENGITATMEYLIVDQKQVILYFRLDSDEYDYLSAMADPFNMDGSNARASIVGSDWRAENGELLSTTINFLDGEQVPEQLRVVLNVYKEQIDDSGDLANRLVASPEFILDIDPTYTAQGRVVEQNQSFTIAGQTFTVTDLEFYPTHMRIHVAGALDNTAWLNSMTYYLELPDGTQVQSGTASGLSGSGRDENDDTCTFYAESTFFDHADRLKLVITGAHLLNRDAELVEINLKTGETGALPLNGELVSCEPGEEATARDGEQVLKFRFHTTNMSQVFSMVYYDEEGNEYYSDHYGMSTYEDDGVSEQFFYLKDYPDDVVYLQPYFNREWSADTPIIVPLETQ